MTQGTPVVEPQLAALESGRVIGLLKRILSNGFPVAARFTGGITVTGASSIAQPAWVAPTLLNGFTIFGGGYMAPGYFKDSMGIVHLRGVLAHGGTTPALNTVIFTLPAGSLPTAGRELFTVSGDNAAARVDVDTAGNVIFSIGTTTSYLSLDGITFDTR